MIRIDEASFPKWSYITNSRSYLHYLTTNWFNNNTTYIKHHQFTYIFILNDLNWFDNLVKVSWYVEYAHFTWHRKAKTPIQDHARARKYWARNRTRLFQTQINILSFTRGMLMDWQTQCLKPSQLADTVGSCYTDLSFFNWLW